MSFGALLGSLGLRLTRRGARRRCRLMHGRVGLALRACLVRMRDRPRRLRSEPALHGALRRRVLERLRGRRQLQRRRM